MNLDSDFIDRSISIIQSTIALLGLIIAAWQLRYLAKQIKETKNWNKQNATFEYIDECRKSIALISKDTKKKIGLNDLINIGDNEKIISILNEKNKCERKSRL